MSDELPYYAWYVRYQDGGVCVDLNNGEVILDIRDAVYLRHQLDLAIRDYEKEVR